MPIYKANVQATTNATPATAEQFIELKAPTGVTHLLRRVRVTVGDGSAAPADNELRVEVWRNSAAGTATSGTTPAAIKNRTNAPASGATLVGKNGTNAFTTGANTDKPVIGACNERGIFEWIPAVPAEYIEHSATAAYIAIVITCSAASRKVNVEIEWEE